MEDLSLHILDIAENALRADARLIEIVVERDRGADRLTVTVRDNGTGMDGATLARVRDPFFTTKNKKTGLGIPLLSQAAEQAEGRLTIESQPGRGTTVTAVFRWSSIDRPALGDMGGTVLTLIAGHPECDVVYEERLDGSANRLDTAEIRKELEDVPITDPAVLDAIRTTLKEEFNLMNEGTAHEQ